MDLNLSPANEETPSLDPYSDRDLQKARLAKGYSLEDLAIATGLTEAELRLIESGQINIDSSQGDRVWSALK